MKRILSASLACAALLLTGGEAAAFCRTTTCTCTASQQVNGGANPCQKVCPTDENGCKTTGKPVAWSGRCIGYSLDLRGTANLSADQWTDAITGAFLAWGAADCGDGKKPSIDVRQLRDVACGKSEYDSQGPNANVVFFEDNGWDGRDVDHLLALTNLHFDHTTGEIYDADMAVNTAAHDFSIQDSTEKFDLISVVTHEVGHFLGLDHSNDKDAVMYFQYSAGDIRRQLSPDDVAGICAAYPPARNATCDPTPKGGLKDTCANAQTGCSAAAAKAVDADPSGLVAGFLGVIALPFGRRLVRRRRR